MRALSARLRTPAALKTLTFLPVALALTLGIGMEGCTPHGALVQNPTKAASVATVGSPALDFTGHDLAGKTIQLSSFVGKHVVLLTFSITFCEPCVAELPHLRAIYAENKEKGLVILGIAMDGPETIANVAGFVQRHQLDYPMIADEDAHISSLYNPSKAAPLSVLIDKSGKITMLRTGYFSGDEKLLREEVAKALDGAGGANEAPPKAAKTIR